MLLPASTTPPSSLPAMTDRLVLHAARWRLALAFAAPLGLLGIAAAGFANGGPNLAGGIVLALGLGLGTVVLLDLPVRVEFDSAGVTRRCVARTQHVRWDEVTAVTRAHQRPQRQRRGQDEPPAPRRHAGLVLRKGARRHVLLVDRCESHAEWTVARRLVRDTPAAFTAGEPPLDQPPAGRGPEALHVRRT